MQAKTIISTVGTSLLTNGIGAEERKVVTKTANYIESELSKEEKDIIDALTKRAKETLLEADATTLRAKSAELNGILGIYGGSFPKAKLDYHILIATDTYQGQETANLLEEILKKNGFNNILIKQPKDFSTKDKHYFDKGIKELLKWFHESEGEFSGYKASSSEVIFNLTGSFKSLQGYLNTIGMFHADKIVYIFESGGELIEIPKLPIKIEFDKLDKFKIEFSLMAQEYMLGEKAVKGIPAIFLEEISTNNFILSYWGELVWNQAKEGILSKELCEFDNIEFEKSFERDFKNELENSKKAKLQETLAKVSKLLLENNGNIGSLKGDGGVLYENYKNKFIAQQPLGHFRINLSLRVSCVYNKANKKLVLRYYGTHEHVEQNEKI